MPGPCLPNALRALAAQQRGVVGRAVLRCSGVTANQVDHQVRAGRWQVFGPHAVLLHNGEPTTAQLQWIAVTNCGAQGGALAGPTAAALLGLRGYESVLTHVLVADGTRIRPQPGVVVHRTRRPLFDDLHPSRLPPVTRLERSVVDAASWLPKERDACALLAAAVQQRLTTAERLVCEVGAAVRMPRRRLFTLTLGDIAGGAHSLAELDFGPLCRRAGLPRPLRQQVRTDSSGRRRYLDVELPFGRRPATFAIELDGALHLQPAAYWDDMTRSNDVTISGTPVLRFPAVALRLEPDAVMRQVRRMYES